MYTEKNITVQDLLSMPFFYDANKEDLADFIELLDLKNLEQNRYLFKEGDESKSVFFMLKGSVKLKKKLDNGEEELIDNLEAPQILGELAVVNTARRHFSVITTDEFFGAELSCEKFEELILIKPLFAVNMIRKIANALNLKLKHHNIP